MPGADRYNNTMKREPRGPSVRQTVAIVGGGFSGGAVAYHLAGLLPEFAARIVIYEPRSRLGAGLAYDTNEPAHRINVPAERMSLVPGDEGHFVRWLHETDALAGDADAVLLDGRLFPRRSVFGSYVDAQIRPLIDAKRIEHHRVRVTSITRVGSRWRVMDEVGGACDADIVIIATTHPPPHPPRELESIAGDPRLITDATAPDALAPIRANERLLIVGTGLTMADVVAALHARRHRGRILAISRRGLRSRGHAGARVEPFGDFSSPPEISALSLLRRVRAAVAAAEREGQSWHGAFDAVRKQGDAVWAALSIAERRRLVARLRPFWDVHRFRVAPMVESSLDLLISQGVLVIAAARLVEATASLETVRVGYRRRGETATQYDDFDRIIVTTGPAHGDILSRQPALASMHAAGFITPDAVGLGLSCDRRARLLDRHGRPTAGLLLAGPLARGEFGELMGLGEVANFALFVAGEAVRTIIRPARSVDAA
jgi:uncharacterized NAD(P)/FAD-binding protein YdhS